jgi:uncharacterized protein YggE
MHRLIRWVPLLSIIICPTLALAQDEPGPSTIEITQSATVTVQPNTAKISFAVETNADVAQTAVRQNADLTEQVLSAVKRIGKPQDSFQTSGFNLIPVYREKTRIKPSGFRVTNTVVVTTPHLEQLGNYIDAAADAGASRIGGLWFSHDDEDYYQREAAVVAMQKAKETAAALADAADLEVVRVLRIQYHPRGPVHPRARVAMTTAERTPIEVGVVGIEASVTVVFQLH